MNWQKRDRWYSASGQSRSRTMAMERSGGSRRLISLIILLVLVVLLIQQTSDKGKVEQLAHSIGLLPKRSIGGEEKSQPLHAALILPNDLFNASADQTPSNSGAFESVMLIAADSEVHRYTQFWGALFSSASPQVIDQLVRKRTFLQQTPIAPSTPPDASAEIQPTEQSSLASEAWESVTQWLPGAEKSVDQWLEIDPNDEQLKSFREELRRAASWFAVSAKTGPDVNSTPLMRSLSLALDRRVLRQVVDNSPWKTTERVAFLRSWIRIDDLQQAFKGSELLRSQLPVVDIAQLMSQGDFYRGKPIRFRGRVARVDANGTINDSDLKRREYQIVWVRPNESSNQPVCIYVSSSNSNPQSVFKVDTEVEMTGMFFKRLAYASQRGGDVAPLLLAAELKVVDSSHGSAGASGRVSESSAFAQLYSKSLSYEDWIVPVDLDKPAKLLDQQLAPSLIKMTSITDQASPKELCNRPEVFASLFELERCSPEIDIVLAAKRPWVAGDGAELRKIKGIVSKVDRIAIDTSTLPSFQATHLFRCTLSNPVDCQQPSRKVPSDRIDVIVQHVPKSWDIESELVQPCEVAGAIFKASNASDSSVPSVMLATKLDWVLSGQMELAATKPQLSGWQQRLLEMGWNLTWNDQLKELHNKPLSQSDSSAYYRLLEIANRSQKSKTFGVTDGVPILDVIKMPGQHNLDRTSMQAKIVRVSKVNVDDPAQSKLLGANSYYQMDAFADIGQTSIQMRNSSGGEPIVFDREFPVTLVCLEAPEWLLGTAESSPSETVWYPRTHVEVSGWFYRFWSYKTEQLSSSANDSQRQVTPLIAIDAISFGTPDRPGVAKSTGGFGNQLTTIGTALFGILAICWFVFGRPKKSRLKSFSLSHLTSKENESSPKGS